MHFAIEQKEVSISSGKEYEINEMASEQSGSKSSLKI